MRANVEAIDFGALAIHDGELRPLQFEFLADDPSDAVEARALCFARKYNLEAECGDDDRQRCVAASIAAAARDQQREHVATRPPDGSLEEDRSPWWCGEGAARVGGACRTAAEVGAAMGARLAARAADARPPELLVHISVPKTGSMSLIAALKASSRLETAYTGKVEWLAEYACQRPDELLARCRRARARGKVAYAPGHVPLAAARLCVPPQLDAAYLFALREPLATAHSAYGFYRDVFDELADATPEWVSGSVLGGDAHVNSLTQPRAPLVECDGLVDAADGCQLDHQPNAVRYFKRADAACAARLARYRARDERAVLEAAKARLASLDAFVIMERARESEDVIACLLGERVDFSSAGARRNPTKRAAPMNATQRAVYEQATRIDAELYAFALSVHEHLTAAVRAQCPAVAERAAAAPPAFSAPPSSPRPLRFEAPANGTVADGAPLTVVARTVTRDDAEWIRSACGGSGGGGCAARVDVWHGEPASGGVVAASYGAPLVFVAEGGERGDVAATARVDGVHCNAPSARRVEVEARPEDGPRGDESCANECWVTLSFVVAPSPSWAARADHRATADVKATTRAPLLALATRPREVDAETAAFLSGAQLDDATCRELAWAHHKHNYPLAMCAHVSRETFERAYCAYSLGDYIGMPRLALLHGDYTESAVRESFPRRAARDAAVSAYGASSLLARYYARVAAAHVGFAWTEHPHAPLLNAALDDWLVDAAADRDDALSAASPDGALPRPRADEIVVHLRSGDRSRRFQYWGIGHLPAVDAYGRLICRVAAETHAARVTIIAASEFENVDALAAVRDDVDDVCHVVATRARLPCARGPPGLSADADLAYMAQAPFLVVHFGGFSAAAAVVARGRVFGGPLFAPYAAGVREARRAAALDGERTPPKFVMCSAPRAHVDVRFELVDVGVTTIFARAHRLDREARDVAVRFQLACGSPPCWAAVQAELETQLENEGALVGAVVHTVGDARCAVNTSFWARLDARGFAVVEHHLSDADASADAVARADGRIAALEGDGADVLPGDAVVLCLRAADDSEATARALAAAAARAQEALGARVAILAELPSACPSASALNARLAAAAVEHGVRFFALEPSASSCRAPGKAAEDLRLGTDHLQREFDSLVAGLTRPRRRSVAELEGDIVCR